MDLCIRLFPYFVLFTKDDDGITACKDINVFKALEIDIEKLPSESIVAVHGNIF